MDEVAEEPIVAKVGAGPLDCKRRVPMAGPRMNFQRKMWLQPWAEQQTLPTGMATGGCPVSETQS